MSDHTHPTLTLARVLDLGPTHLVKDEHLEGRVQILLEGAEQLQRSGVTVALADFALWDDLERAAWLEAGERRRRHEAVWLGLALAGKGPEVLAPIDGGQAMLQAALERRADMVEAAARGEL